MQTGKVMCNLNHLLKSDLHILLIAIEGHKNPNCMNIILENDVLKMHSTWEFQGCLLVRIQSFHCSALGLIPGWRTEILHATEWCGQKKTERSVT